MSAKHITQDDKEIGERIKEVRKFRAIKQADMVAKLCIELRTYQRYEQGKTQIPLTMLKQIAQFLEVSTSYLLGEIVDVNGLTNAHKIIANGLSALEAATNHLERYHNHPMLPDTSQ